MHIAERERARALSLPAGSAEKEAALGLARSCAAMAVAALGDGEELCRDRMTSPRGRAMCDGAPQTFTRAALEGLAAEQSFDKAERREANGSFTAPFSGIHGWFWENPGADPVTVRLASAGFYTSAVEIRSDRSRQPRPLRASGELR